MVHSRVSNVGGMVDERAEATRTGSVEVRVVVWALQASRKRPEVVGEKARERKLLLVGGMILEPDQRALGGVVVEVGGVALGRRVSRLGSKGALGG